MMTIFGILRFINAFVAVLCLIFTINSRNEIPLFRQARNVMLVLGMWNFIQFIGVFTTTPKAAIYLASLNGVGVALCALFLFYFAVAYCIPSFSVLYRWLIAIIPIITCILSLTSQFHPFFILLKPGIRFITPIGNYLVYGFWFYIHAAYSYALVLISCILLAKKAFSAQTKNRRFLVFFTIAIIFFILVNMVSTFIGQNIIIHYLVIFSHLISISSFSVSVLMDSDETTLVYGKKNFFQNLDAPIFIFNSADELLQTNESAQVCFDRLDIPLKKYSRYASIFSSLHFIEIEQQSRPNASSTRYLKHIKTSTVFYSQITKILRDKHKQTSIGKTVLLYSIDYLTPIIKKLEASAYVDSLCGCFNRSSFDARKNEIITSSLPMALLVADIDGLKKVNDKFGHSEGDEYIRICASILKRATRASDTLFRIGGDEFAVFLPAFKEAGISKIQSIIKAECAKQQKPYFFSISVGFSIINTIDENFDRHFEKADAAMYKQKQTKTLP